MQLLASFQAGRGLSQGPGALDLALGNAHRAVVGQDGRRLVPHQPRILTQHLGAESWPQHCIPVVAMVSNYESAHLRMPIDTLAKNECSKTQQAVRCECSVSQSCVMCRPFKKSCLAVCMICSRQENSPRLGTLRMHSIMENGMQGSTHAVYAARLGALLTIHTC